MKVKRLFLKTYELYNSEEVNSYAKWKELFNNIKRLNFDETRMLIEKIAKKANKIKAKKNDETDVMVKVVQLLYKHFYLKFWKIIRMIDEDKSKEQKRRNKRNY